MRELAPSRPAIMIDLKKYRIRIHRITLHLLGNPEYICLLVNPVDQIIAVCCATKSDHLAHCIKKNSLSRKKSYELYSVNLVQSLHEVCTFLEDNRAYRIYGEIIPFAGVAQFRMCDSLLVNESHEQQ